MSLELSHVCKEFRGRHGQSVQALDQVSLTVEPGSFVAICGPSGCGKSSLLLTAGTLLKPDQGQVVVDGQTPYQLSPDARADFRASKFGFVFQQFHLVPYLSVRDNVLAATIRGKLRQTPQCELKAEELLERFGLADRMQHTPQELSVGERQRCALARALINGPTYLLADEPTGNLDRPNGAIVLQALREFVVEGGAVLLVTHDPIASEMADAVYNMDAGRLAAAPLVQSQ